jgi:hypothetical protein
MKFTSLHRQRLRVFPTPWRLTTPSLSALFHAESALGILALQRLSPPVQPYTIPGADALLTLRQSVEPSLGNKTILNPLGGLFSGPRLQGFAPHEDPPHHLGGLARNKRVSLMGFPLQGSPPHRSDPAFTASSPHGFSQNRASTKPSTPQGIAFSVAGCRQIGNRPSWGS